MKLEQRVTCHHCAQQFDLDESKAIIDREELKQLGDVRATAARVEALTLAHEVTTNFHEAPERVVARAQAYEKYLLGESK